MLKNITERAIGGIISGVIVVLILYTLGHIFGIALIGAGVGVAGVKKLAK